MDRKKKVNKYDIIIYSSLMVAIVFIVIAVKSYYDNLDENETFFSSFKSAVEEINDSSEPQEEIQIEEEPDIMKSVDKKAIINNELKLIVAEKSLTEYLNKEMIQSWQKYEISNINFIRTIVEDYYCYEVDIKIPNKNAKLPTSINIGKSTETYNVITIYFNIAKKDNNFTVKAIETPNR